MSNQVAIQIENIGKQYPIVHTEYDDKNTVYKTIRGKAAKFFLPNRDHKPYRRRIRIKGKFWALKNVNLTINKGDNIALIGRNGSGKSTLLKILSRITKPTTGSTTLSGKVASLLEVGTGFHPELSGRENIYLNGAIIGQTRQETKRNFDKIVAFSGIEEFIDMPLKRYSSGMETRLGFATAIHTKRDIIFLDEVLSVSDAKFREKCVNKICDVSKHHEKTIIFVSHYTGYIKQLCNRAVLLKKGELVYEGSLEDTIGVYMGSEENENPAVIEKSIHGIKLLKLSPPSKSIKTGNNWIFNFRLHSEADFKECQYNLIIYNHKNPNLISIKKKQAFNIKKGTFELNTEIKNTSLNAGEYQCRFSIETADGDTLISVKDILAGVITDTPNYIEEVSITANQVEVTID